jgi:hypothetical protein
MNLCNAGHHHITVEVTLTAPTNMSSCRGQRLATPVTTPSCRNFTLQLLLASHQLSMMMMASHHRRRFRTSGIQSPPPRNSFTPPNPCNVIAPSSSRGSITQSLPSSGITPQPVASGIAPPTVTLLHCRPPSHMDLQALIPIVGAASSSPIFFYLSISQSLLSLCLSRTHTRTYQGRRTQDLCLEHSLGDHRGYIVHVASRPTFFPFTKAAYLYRRFGTPAMQRTRHYT